MFIELDDFIREEKKKFFKKEREEFAERRGRDVDYPPSGPPCAGENMYFAFAHLPNVTCACRGPSCSDSTNQRLLRRPQTGPLSSKPCCHDFTSTLLMNTCEAGVSGAGEGLGLAGIAGSFIVV